MGENDVSNVGIEPHDAQVDVMVFQDIVQLVKIYDSKMCRGILNKNITL